MLTRQTIDNIVSASLPEDEIKSHLESLSETDVSAQLVADFVGAVRATLPPEVSAFEEITGTIDSAGTGGSGLPHFNVSTTAAFVMAAGGLAVAKCGSRAIGGRCGSFDLLEALNVPLALPPEAVKEILDETGMAFLFVQHYYPGLAKLAPIRRAMSKRTIFNIIGPLLNPIRPYYRVMGISSAQVIDVLAQYLEQDKTARRSILVRSDSGLDELETDVPATIVDVMQGYINRCRLTVPAKANGKAESKLTFSAQENYQLFFEIISGRGPKWLTEIVCLNAAAGFLASGYSNLDSCLEKAHQVISEGIVAQKVEQVRRAYAKFAS